jgi:hypothetical protein
MAEGTIELDASVRITGAVQLDAGVRITGAVQLAGVVLSDPFSPPEPGTLPRCNAATRDAMHLQLASEGGSDELLFCLKGNFGGEESYVWKQLTPLQPCVAFAVESVYGGEVDGFKWQILSGGVQIHGGSLEFPRSHAYVCLPEGDYTLRAYDTIDAFCATEAAPPGTACTSNAATVTLSSYCNCVREPYVPMIAGQVTQTGFTVCGHPGGSIACDEVR